VEAASFHPPPIQSACRSVKINCQGPNILPDLRAKNARLPHAQVRVGKEAWSRRKKGMDGQVGKTYSMGRASVAICRWWRSPCCSNPLASFVVIGLVPSPQLVPKHGVLAEVVHKPSVMYSMVPAIVQPRNARIVVHVIQRSQHRPRHHQN